MKRLLICALCLAGLNQIMASDHGAAAPIDYQPALRAIPSGELPAQALELVLLAKPDDRASTTVGVTKAAVTVNPAAAPSIVGAIARKIPDMASVAAGTAAAEQPKQATAIAKAAAAAAPSQAGKIVAAICRAVPKEYRSVAITVAQTVPNSARDILTAVATAIPELKAGLEDILAVYTRNTISVSAALDQASGAKTVLGTVDRPTSRGPTVAPPFIPISSTPKTITPNTSGGVPTGGRDYGTP